MRQTVLQTGICRSGKGGLAVVLLFLAASAAAQTPPAQEPGAGAQLRTGTASGIEQETRLQNLLADHDFPLLAAELDKLPAEQAQFYRGLLANRDNDLKKSIALLEPLVETIAASGDATKEKLARKALAEDYLRSGDWAKAAKAYETLAARLNGKLTADERDEIEPPLKLLPLARGNPSTTIEPCEPFTLQVARNPLGLVDVPVFVDARPRSWMLDPTAPFNWMARSTAKAVGLKLSAASATIRTLTGRPIEARSALIPRLTIGGRITLRNVTVFVFDDSDYAFPKSHYRVEGVLGYPALAAMGKVTFTQNSTMEVEPTLQPRGKETQKEKASGARFYLDGDRVILALGRSARPDGQIGEERMFVVDAGGQQSYFTARYYDEHADEFANLKMELYVPPKLEDAPPTPAYVAESAPLYIGDRAVNLHYVHVLTQPVGAAAIDDVYGVLGLDALEQFDAYAFDYRTMRFTAKSRE